MSKDRSVRFLTALGGASTSRVLNLLRIHKDNAGNPEHQQKPLFVSPILNKAFILKRRTRSDETYLFAAKPKSVSTKIVIPFDDNDLDTGGRSLFVDQRGYSEALRQAGSYSTENLERDMFVLKLLDAVPSLDPFLLREHMRNNNIDIADTHFAISQGDQDRMHHFVTQELSKLILLAGGGGGGSSNGLVSAMLSTNVDEKLEPLRLTLNLSGDDFREGVFSWRGFLYYKWSMAKFWPDVMGVLREINGIQPLGAMLPDQKDYLTRIRRSIIEMVRDNGNCVSQALSVYDASFGELVDNQSPKTFRDFLLSAPYMFLEMGEKLGAVSHIVSFWHQRFPRGQRPHIDAEELAAIFYDFAGGFAERTQADAPPVRNTAA